MFAKSTIETIRHVLAADPGAEVQDVNLVMDAVTRGRKSKAVRITAREAADILGISYPTFWRRIKSGAYRLTVIRESRKAIFFLRAEVERTARGIKQ
jgi:predicted DNA-binding protein (UPF0251 family)